MKNDHTINKVKGIPEFAYIPFDEAYKFAENLTRINKPIPKKEFYGLIGRKKTGWLGLEVKSIGVWDLVSGKKMNLTERFHKISSSRDPEEKLRLKKEAFLNIPLFKIIFEKYFHTGLPKKSELSRFLESEYKINPTYSPAVVKTIIDSIEKYFKEYGKSYVKDENILKRETEKSLNDFSEKKNLINIKITSPIGNFNLEAASKKEFEKIMKIINTLWDERSDTDENQEEGAHET